MKEPDTLYQVEHEILSLVEETGAFVSQLREALADLNNGNLPGCSMVVDDAISTLSNIETKASEMAAELAKWNGTAQTPPDFGTKNL